MALAADTPTRPDDIWLWTPGQKTAQPLTDLNPQVRQWALGQVREVSWTSSLDGRKVYGTLVTPPGYAPGTPIKTVIQGHGGPEGFWWSGWLGSWHDWAQMLATHGYAVLLPNPRGSDGQDIGFTRGPINDWGGGDFQDVLDGLDMLVAEKITDPTRVGIGGWSYGGFLSAWAVTHSDRFRTAIVGAAPVDISSMLLTTDTPDFVAGYFGRFPENLARMDASSPVRFVDRVKVPVLVLHGEQDRRVPVSLGLSFYRGLRLLGKDATMVSYPREPHWTYEPAHQTDIQERVLAWFDAHL
ncbi:alpha/beta hydrolase family protein [Caulobacter sp. UC70_42]|uniref:alpha/beta hydrolase family protein n=1 Tax=Caulobacter sp. UC70_42 TaxID=3374551 RepID=UPI0037582F16